MKLILREEKLKKFIQQRVDSIKINNLENKLFSEEDLIREVEKEKSNFISKKFGIFSRMSYKILDITNIHNEKEFNEKSELYFNDNVVKVLKTSKSIKEFERLVEISKKEIVKIKDFKFILSDELLISFMFDQDLFEKDEIINIIKIIKGGKAQDYKNSSQKEIINTIRFLKNVINCKKENENEC